jgi:hypothetical protein
MYNSNGAPFKGQWVSMSGVNNSDGSLTRTVEWPDG